MSAPIVAPIAPGSPASVGYAQNAVAGQPDSTMVIAPNALAETVPATAASTTLSPASGSLYLWSVHLGAGTVVSNVGFVSAAAAITPAHWWACLVDQKYVLRATSTDQTTTAVGASTWFSLPMVTAYTTQYSGLHYLGVMFAAATPPTVCSNPNPPLQAMLTGTGAPTSVIGGVSNTGATVALALGVTLTAPTAAQAAVPYLYCQ